MASPLIDIPSPSEAIASIPSAATMAIKKTKGLHFSLPLNRPLNRLRHKTMTYTKSHKVTHQQDLPEASLEHSEAHHSQKPFTSARADSKSASSSSLISSNNLDVLSADVQLQVFSFLDLPSLRNMMATNRDLRALLVSDSAYQVWHKICQSKFFLLEEAYDSEHGMFLQDECALPIAAVSAPNHAFCRYNRVNLPLLLSMTPDHVPTGMMMMADQENNSEDDVVSNTRNEGPPPMIQILSDDEDDDSIIGGAMLDDSIVSSSSSPSSSSFDISLRFNGNVGSGQVYSVKANHPLPKPTLQVNNSKKYTSKRSLRQKLKSRRSSSSSKKVLWNPMVVPYNSLGDAPRMIHVTPRLVSYFEISVLAAPQPELRRPLEDPEGPLIQDCVAIGLATPSFEPRGTLPGWCSSSFGYHSDNGGLYHGSGHARQRTESFGPGDTVGMGVDYVSKTIFVTKNGRYLGSAYDVFTMDFLATQDLYPVVGMDSKDTVNVNYGVSKPFHFNLASYCQRQQQNMVPVKSRISTKFQFTHDHSNGVEVGC